MFDKFYSLLRIEGIRLKYVRFRYWWLKNKMKISSTQTSDIGETTISHNISAFEQLASSAFQCGGRMGLLIYPIVSYFKFITNDCNKLRILIVGCRTEDDIYWLRSYGFPNTMGFDLFSYSPHVMTGDIHKTNFPDSEFDVVLLGWMISYSKNPSLVIKECHRILKHGGLFGIGVDHDSNQEKNGIMPPRVNSINSTGDIKALINNQFENKVIFEYDHFNPLDARVAVIVKSV